MSELLSAITAPIQGDNPLGQNINYDPDFDALKSEIGKLGEIDYDSVETTAVSLLRDKSKDLRVLSFLSFGYLRNENWEALADVFDGMAQLADQNYDGLYPERDRAKQNAVKWLSEARYLDMVTAKAPTETDHMHIVRLREALGKLKPLLEAKFPEGSPFPAGLYTAAQKWESATKPKPKAEPGAGAASGQPGAGVQEPMDTPQQAQAIGRKAALFLIEKEPEKPMGYRLLRALRWDLVEKAPPATGTQTQLAGPPAEQRAFFQGLIAKEDWPSALPAAEKAFASKTNHFWLDIQRVSATACSKLGAKFAGVREAICVETALLLKRVPELADLNFSDGAPFCDASTKDWIAAEVSGVLGTGGGASGAGSGPAESEFEEEKKEISKLVAGGKIEQALGYLHRQIRESASERDNFRRSIQLGNLLLSNKRSDIALAILESLDDKVTAYNLDNWDPQLVVEAWTLLIHAYKVAKAGKPQNVQMTMQDKQNTILQKLSRTDPKSAFNITT